MKRGNYRTGLTRMRRILSRNKTALGDSTASLFVLRRGYSLVSRDEELYDKFHDPYSVTNLSHCEKLVGDAFSTSHHGNRLEFPQA